MRSGPTFLLVFTTCVIGAGCSGHAVGGASDARFGEQLIERVCKTAGDTIYETAENVSSILREDVAGNGTHVGGITARDSGISWTHPHYMFDALGLDYLEYRRGNSYARRSLRNGVGAVEEVIAEPESQIIVRFSRIDLDAEAANWRHPVNRGQLSVEGRRIEVLMRSTGRVIATRDEYFLVNMQIGSGILICQRLGQFEETPKIFLSRVINPTTFPCLTAFQEQCRMRAQKCDWRELDEELYKPCVAAYWKSRANRRLQGTPAGGRP